MKRPAFQFYPADWRKDAALQSCSIGARGVWHEMLCVMHECRPYGHLTLNGKPMEVAAVCRLIGVDTRDYSRALEELELAGVFSRLNDGTIFSRRMVRDEHIRAVRAEAGRQGGNPLLLNGKDNHGAQLLLNQPDKQDANLEPTPSSSSAFASSASAKGDVEPVRPNGRMRASRLPDDWTLPDDWKAWAVQAYHLKPERAVRISLAFRDFWISKPGTGGTKLNWLATWRNWVRKECGE